MVETGGRNMEPTHITPVEPAGRAARNAEPASGGTQPAGNGPTIRRAKPCDIPQITVLLHQVLDIHHAGRPDLFKANATKYTNGQLADIIADDRTPVFVAVEPGGDSIAESDTTNDGRLLGYAFCIFQRHADDNILTDILTLYIDDLCVDAAARGGHVGTALYRHVLDFARESGCYNVTLNVWACNEASKGFYEHCGLKPQKIGMETIL